MSKNKQLVLIILLAFFSLTGLSCNKPKDLFVYKTSDSGKAWEQKAMTDKKKSLGSTNVLCIAIDPQNPGNVFVGTEGRGVFKSQNSADNWQQTSLKQGTIYSIAIDPKDPNNVYAGGSVASLGKIFKSTNNGTEFSEVYSETHAKVEVKSLIVDHYNSKIVYAGLTSGAFLKSSDLGKSWVSTNWFYGPIETMGMSPKDSRKIYVAVQGRYAYLTKDGGKTWKDLKESLTEFRGANLISAIAFDPKDDRIAYLGSHYGVVRTQNDGNSWTDIGLIIVSGKFQNIAMAVSPKNQNTIYVGVDTTIHKTIDGGKNWTVKKITNNFITSLAIDPKKLQNVYAGVREIKQ